MLIPDNIDYPKITVIIVICMKLTDRNVSNSRKSHKCASNQHALRTTRELLDQLSSSCLVSVCRTVEGGPRTVRRWFVPNFDHLICISERAGSDIDRIKYPPMEIRKVWRVLTCWEGQRKGSLVRLKGINDKEYFQSAYPMLSAPNNSVKHPYGGGNPMVSPWIFALVFIGGWEARGRWELN